MQSLQDFILELEKQGNLIRVTAEVSTYLEMTEIQTRFLKHQKEAILFENVIKRDGTKSKIPVLVNLFGTKERVALAMQRKLSELEELGELLAFMRHPKPVASLKEAFAYLPLLKKVMAMKPKIVKSSPAQEIIFTEDKINLYDLPIQWCWPNEPAPLITWGLIATKGPNFSSTQKTKRDEEDDYNLGIYRMQILAKKKAIMRWLAHRGGALQFKRWKEKNQGRDMPVAVIIGADPQTIIAAVMPLPETLSEYKFAGLLRGAKTTLVPAKTIDILVPSTAEIIIEGYVSCTEVAKEGPYGDHTGYYNDVEKFPIFNVTAITMKKNPVYLSTFTGRPPDEPSILGEALNDVFVPLIKQQFPEITDFFLPSDACSYRMAVVSIKKAYAGHAKRIMMGVWSYLRQFMYTKFIIIVDSDINARSYRDVIWAISTNVDPARDVTIIENTPIDYLDFASPLSGLGSKMAIDATAKLHPETNRNWGTKITMDEETINTIDKKWQDLGLGAFLDNIWQQK